MIENIKDYKYVDLGLPSGTLWCNINLGATSKHDIGGYYQWGGEENIIENNNYKYGEKYKINKTQYDGNVPGAKLTRDIVPGGEYDTVTHFLGTKWQMPTELQFKELFDDNYVKKDWVTYNIDDENSISGMLIKSIKNGNTIFLPAAGYIRTVDDNDEPDPNGKFSKLINKNIGGSYWSTFIDTRNYIFASNLYFWKEDTDDTIKFTIDSDGSSDFRWVAIPIRPVYYRSKIVSNEISTDEKNIQKPISGNLYEHFLDNKNFSINKINTIYDEETPLDSIDNTDDINKIILDRLMKTNNNYESNVTACSNSLIFYKYKYKQNSQESNKYYTGINLYYCDNKGLCFPITQNMYTESVSEGTSNSEGTGNSEGTQGT